MIEGKAITFRCRLTSPFHTARQTYANLAKCAPFILGSTIRGAVLKYLIEAHCPPDGIADLRQLHDPDQVAAYHLACDRDCPARPFFQHREYIWFTCAPLDEEKFGSATRIALSRPTASVAEGAIFSVEMATPGTEFTFEVFLLGPAQVLVDTVKGAVEAAGRWSGLGGHRSVGFGRFELLDGQPQADEFDDRITRELLFWPQVSSSPTLVFLTPLVLGEKVGLETLTGEGLAVWLATEIQRIASQVTGDELAPLPIERVDFRLKPEFVGRFSYERGLRENRLVAWQGSRMTLHPESGTTLDSEQLAMAAVLGIGEWNHWGFGRFRLQQGT
ncbi:MAG: hypothetical protein FJ014_16795 [Chloroflexi bacterium]|nr:hypothetical protein [Chloroflexota bacterium]